MRRLSGLWAGLAVSAAFVAVALFQRGLVVAACGGEYVYPIDDTYIHIAMAKCLAFDGTWGVEAGKTAFCSSSPLWTLLLAGLYRLFGVSETLPWFLALGFNVGLIFAVCRFFADLRLGVCWQLAVAVCTAVAGPVFCTTALGMEHAMHAFFIVASLFAAYGLTRGSRLCRVVAPLCAAAATASRYESLFLLAPVGCVVCGFEAWGRWRRRERIVPWSGLAFLAAAGLPVVVYGVWAVCCGGHFFPNSLLLKGGFNTSAELFAKAVELLGAVKAGYGFIYLLPAALAVVAALPRTTLVWRLFAVSVVIAVCGQIVLADVGQLCRYEAYLTSVGVLVLVASVAEAGIGPFPTAFVPIGVLSVTMCVFAERAREAFPNVVHSSSDIQSQQVLVTRILSELPEGARGCVALNDLGYMVLHGNFPILDIWGLGSQDATELILGNGKTWTAAANEVLFRKHDVKYVAVFETWFPWDVMPRGTIDVAWLKLGDNLACGSDTVVLRATSSEAADALRRHLRKYEEKLPKRVSMWISR